MSRWGSLILTLVCLSSASDAEKLRKNARSYSSSSSSSNLYGGSSSSSGGDGYNDNFDSMFNSMDLNNNGNTQKIKVALPNPPHPPKPPKPMKAPNMGNYENDPNRMPSMPRPPAPPSGFGPMDIEFSFPSYEPNVDDSFFDSDQGSNGYGGSSGGYGSSSSNNNNNNNGNSNSYGSSNSNNGNSGNSNYGSSSSGNNGGSLNYGGSSSGGSYSTTTKATTPAPGSCTPYTEPGITNGVCVGINYVTYLCSANQLAQSPNCSSTQFCCFTLPTTTTSGPATAASTTTSVTARSTSSTVSGATTSTTKSSGGSSSGSTAGSTTGSTTGSTASSTAGSTAGTTATTTQKTAATTTTGSTAGQTTTTQQTTTTSSGAQTVTTQNSGGQTTTTQSSGGQTTTASYSTMSGVTTAPNGGACSPLSNPSVTNGQCFNLNALQANCRGIQMAKSNQCAYNQFCCFSSPNAQTTTTAAPGTSASSSSGPVTVSTGPVTVGSTPTQATAATTQTVASTTSTMATTAYTTPAAPGNKIGALKDCQPQGKPSSVSGQCVSNANLAAQCAGQSVAFADACSAEEACCFMEAAKRPAACRPRTGTNLASTGECMMTASLSTRCAGRAASKSDDCAAQDWCCLIGPATDSAANPLQVQPINILIGGNDASNNGLKVSVDVAPTTLAPVVFSDVCTPNDNPAVHNGKCLTMRQLSQQCIDKKASSSADCAFGRFCCYSEDGPGVSAQGQVQVPAVAPQQVVTVQVAPQQSPAAAQAPPQPVVTVEVPNQPAVASQPVVTVQVASQPPVAVDTNKAVQLPAVASPTAKTCSPNSNRAVTNGVCMTIRELRSNCVEEKASPSQDCEMGSWCCFTEDGSAVNNVVTEVKVAVVTDAPTVAPVEEMTVAVTEAPKPAVDSEQQCVPNSKPDITNGECMPTKDLRTRCKNQRVSKSPQCKLGHWCCFTDAANPVSLTVNDFSRNINAL